MGNCIVKQFKNQPKNSYGELKTGHLIKMTSTTTPTPFTITKTLHTGNVSISGNTYSMFDADDSTYLNVHCAKASETSDNASVIWQLDFNQDPIRVKKFRLKVKLLDSIIESGGHFRVYFRQGVNEYYGFNITGDAQTFDKTVDLGWNPILVDNITVHITHGAMDVPTTHVYVYLIDILEWYEK